MAAERKGDKGEISAAGLLRANRPKKQKTTSPYNRHITIPLKRSEYLCLRVWAKSCFAPNEYLTSEQLFVRASLQEIFLQTGMGGSPIEMESIRAALAKWLDRKEPLRDIYIEELEAEACLAR